MSKQGRGATGKRTLIGYRSAVLLGCTAVALFVPGTVLAQDAATTGDTTVLETITVQGQGEDDSRTIVATQSTGAGKMATDILETPASVSVITSKEVQDRGAQDVEQVIGYTAGVTTDFYGSDDRFDFFKIRGFDAYQYRDGMSLGDPFGGVREEPYAFERIEVLKGANSTAFGVSDPGGSVNFVSKLPKSERFGEAYATGGSFNHAEAGFDFGDNITEDDTLSYRLTGKFQNAEKEYDYSEDDEKFIMGGVTWRPTDVTSLSLVFDHLNKDGVPGSGGHPIGTDFNRSRFFGEPDYNFQETNRNTFTLLFDHDFGSGLTFNASARYSKANTGFGYAYISATPTDGTTIASRDFYGNDATREQVIVDAHLQYETSFDFVDSNTLVGVEYNAVKNDSDTYYDTAPTIDWENPVYSGVGTIPLYASTSTDNKTKALYIEENLTFADKFIVSAGLRNDWMDLSSTNNMSGVSNSDDLSELTGRLGFTYRITDELSVYTSYAESVVPARIGLEPERGEQYEVGVKYRPDAFPALFSASVYDLTKNNITRTNPATLVDETIGEVRVRGIDLEAKAELVNNLSLTAAYSYMESEIVENGTSGNEGNEMSFVPNHIASLWLNYLLEGNGTRGDMTFGMGARYQSAYYFDDANTLTTDGAITFDAAFSYKIQENTSLQVNVTNLFDEKHVTYGGFGADFYNPGRAIYATIRQTW